MFEFVLELVYLVTLNFGKKNYSLILFEEDLGDKNIDKDQVLSEKPSFDVCPYLSTTDRQRMTMILST